MNWQQILIAVRDAYRNAPNPSQPISLANYQAMLSAFGSLVSLVTIPDTYDTDFRRNLPGGGLSGFQVVTLQQRIADAVSFANANPVYPPAGEGIAENISVILGLVGPSVAQGILGQYQGTFQSILGGNL